MRVMCGSRKYSYLPPRKVFWFESPLLPPGISSLASYFPLNSLAFEIPLPFGIYNDLPWGGYGYFLELHTMAFSDVLEQHFPLISFHSASGKLPFLHGIFL